MPTHPRNHDDIRGSNLVDVKGFTRTKTVGVHRSFGKKAGGEERAKERNRMAMKRVNEMNKMSK